MSPQLTVSAIIVTRNRPAALLRLTLTALMRQTLAPLEILVVDTSPGDAIAQLVENEFSEVQMVHIADGPPCRTWQRNQGIARAQGNIIAFLDDDALAEPGWLAEIVQAYGQDETIGGVGGRVIEGIDLGGNPKAAGQPVATLDHQGMPHADFNSVTPEPVEVEHLLGCNMSFRRPALVEIGGFDEYFDGTAIREETDVCVRMRRAGYRLLYNSKATVDHKAFSLQAHRRVQLETVRSGFPDARMEAYYIVKNFGTGAWLAWYIKTNTRAFARVGKVTYMAFARAGLALAGGTIGLVQAFNYEERKRKGTKLRQAMVQTERK